ncbi:MAG: hypothetical protein AVDCRST_MAG19-2888, partial [uncultured Thermomicrobiales bacterium]
RNARGSRPRRCSASRRVSRAPGSRRSSGWLRRWASTRRRSRSGTIRKRYPH